MRKIILGVLAAHGLILLALIIQHWVTLTPPKRKVIVNTIHIATPAPVTAVKKVVKKSAPPVVAKKQTAVPIKKILKELENIIAAPPAPKKVEIEIPFLPEEPIALVAPPSEVLAAFLQEMLQLPEFGEVKAQVDIDRFGKLQHCEILESKSEKNAEFLKNQLTTLQFPCLNEPVSLTIVFSNL